MIDLYDELVLVIAIISSYTLVVSFLNLISFSKPKPLKPKSEELISIMVPCRNEEDNIDDCVESLINQDYDNIEILLILLLHAFHGLFLLSLFILFSVTYLAELM